MANQQKSTVRITLGTWDRLRDDASSVRYDVFVVEQNVPPEVEMDDDDAVSVHAVAYAADGTPLGTGRLLPDGHIGRMAVHKRARGLGVGGQLLDALIGQGHGDGHRMLVLHAQTHAKGLLRGPWFPGGRRGVHGSRHRARRHDAGAGLGACERANDRPAV